MWITSSFNIFLRKHGQHHVILGTRTYCPSTQDHMGLVTPYNYCFYTGLASCNLRLSGILPESSKPHGVGHFSMTDKLNYPASKPILVRCRHRSFISAKNGRHRFDDGPISAKITNIGLKLDLYWIPHCVVNVEPMLDRYWINIVNIAKPLAISVTLK